MERLQHRREEALPPLPIDLQRGTPESVLSEVAVDETAVDNPDIPDELETEDHLVDGELQDLDSELMAREESVTWHQTDIYQPDPE